MYRAQFFCVLILNVLAISVAVPVIIIEANSLNNFEDNWDYKIKPYSEPILEAVDGNHTLPPTNQRASESSIKLSDEPAGRRRLRVRTGKKAGNAGKSRLSCSACKLGAGLLQRAVHKDDTFEEIKQKFVSICAGLQIVPEDVCNGIFDVYGPDLLPVLNVTQLSPAEICALGLGETCGDVHPQHEWEVTFPDVPKPSIKNLPLPKAGAPTFKILHLSDTHYDPDYVEGSPSICEEPLCCRATSTPSRKVASKKAGKWGSYGSCDTPKRLMESVLENIGEEHQDIDFIIWTGDLPPHDIWNQSKESNLDVIRDTTQQIFEAFPNIPVFPALGNHESIPPGSFAPPWVKDDDHSIDWLYEEVASQWEKWLPSSLNNTIFHGGFYSVLIRPGFRLISLNMNYCHAISWWLYLNSTDPAKELQWLIYELQEAENNGEIVHIIGHIPPGSPDCMKVWSRNYYSIVERYENTIAAQFFGHTHADEFEVFYDTEKFQRPTSIAYLGPSITTYENFNPSYRIYYVDGDYENSTKEIIDHETWTIDLNKANEEGGVPNWYKLYSAREAYGMESLRPIEWGNLIERLVDDKELFDTFYKFYYRDSPVRPDCNDARCILQILCDLKSGRSHDRHHLCHELELIF